METAPFGIVGLETAFPLLYTNFVKTGKLTIGQLLDYMTKKPAEAFSFRMVKSKKELRRYGFARFEAEQIIDRNEFVSKGKNTPFHGQTCTGWPVMTIAAGKVAWEKGSVTQ